jgi:hypothetical protein
MTTLYHREDTLNNSAFLEDAPTLIPSSIMSTPFSEETKISKELEEVICLHHAQSDELMGWVKHRKHYLDMIGIQRKKESSDITVSYKGRRSSEDHIRSLNALKTQSEDNALTLIELEELVDKGNILLQGLSDKKEVLRENLKTQSGCMDRMLQTQTSTQLQETNEISDVIQSQVKSLEVLDAETLQPKIEEILIKDRNKMILHHQEEKNRCMLQLLSFHKSYLQKKRERLQAGWYKEDSCLDKESVKEYQTIERSLEKKIQEMQLELQQLKIEYQLEQDEIEYESSLITHGKEELLSTHIKQKRQHLKIKSRVIDVKGQHNIVQQERHKKVKQLESALDKYSKRKDLTNSNYRKMRAKESRKKSGHMQPHGVLAVHQEELDTLRTQLHALRRKILSAASGMDPLAANHGRNTYTSTRENKKLQDNNSSADQKIISEDFCDQLGSVAQVYYQALTTKKQTITHIESLRQENKLLLKRLDQYYNDPKNFQFIVPPTGSIPIV